MKFDLNNRWYWHVPNHLGIPMLSGLGEFETANDAIDAAMDTEGEAGG